jgi:cytoskeletal protein CcmA (bactofilin family)
MFAEKKQPTSGPERNVLGKATVLKGEINSQGDFRIDGALEGKITTTGRLILGKDAKVTGEIQCAHADVEGTISGNLQCSGTLTLKSTSRIEGDVVVDKLAIEPGAIFNATCSMKGVKTLPNDTQKQPKKAIS